MRRECQERFPRHRLQRESLASGSGMHNFYSIIIYDVNLAIICTTEIMVVQFTYIVDTSLC